MKKVRKRKNKRTKLTNAKVQGRESSSSQSESSRNSTPVLRPLESSSSFPNLDLFI
jgi:hypothetical protein